MFEDILEDKKTRRHYYRDSYRGISRLFYICLLIILLELVLIALIVFNRSSPDYYASNGEGDLTQIFPAPFGSRLKDPTPDLLAETKPPIQGTNNGR